VGPVGWAKAADVHPDRTAKAEATGVLPAYTVPAASGGALTAIGIEYLGRGLFSPLLVSASLNVVGYILMFLFLTESETQKSTPDDASLEEVDRAALPERIEPVVTTAILIGAFLNNVGSLGIFPFLLVPLALEVYHHGFIEQGMEPLMSDITFKWALVLSCFPIILGKYSRDFTPVRLTPVTGRCRQLEAHLLVNRDCWRVCCGECCDSPWYWNLRGCGSHVLCKQNVVVELFDSLVRYDTVHDFEPIVNRPNA